jgi:hypothetical protein
MLQKDSRTLITMQTVVPEMAYSTRLSFHFIRLFVAIFILSVY